MDVSLIRFASRLGGTRRRIPDPFALWRERRALARLDSRLLRDAGISPRTAEIEARRPFWDAPAHWHR